MARYIQLPSIINAAGNKPKEIREYFGQINSSTREVSIAQMNSPKGWAEPGQCPDFNEYTVVLSGMLKVETRQSTYFVKAGESILIERGEWVRYSTPEKEGARYIAVCLPAFSPETVHRDND